MRPLSLLLGFSIFTCVSANQSESDDDVPFDGSEFEALSTGASRSPDNLAIPSLVSTINKLPNGSSAELFDGCGHNGLVPTYLRLPNVYVMGVPSFVSKIDLVTCAKHCTEDIEPLSGENRPCRGFNFQNNNDSPTCEYFDKNTKTGMLNWNAGLRSYYFEKVCLPLPEECRGRAFAFEKRRNQRFVHRVSFNTSVVDDEMGCLDMCLRQAKCYSVNYNRVSRTCELFDGPHNSGATSDRLTESEGVDYFENNCVHEKDRCPGKRLEFFVTKKSEVRGRDVAMGVRSIRGCMRECVEATLFYCRSFEFDSESNECFVVEEGGDQAVPSRNLDLYEPFCTAVDVPCSRPYVFEKVKNRNLIAPNSLSEHLEVDLEECLELCLVNSKCRSFTFSPNGFKCRLLGVTRMDAMTRTVMDVNVDYFELGCSEGVLLRADAVPEDNHHHITHLDEKKTKSTTAYPPQTIPQATCTPNELQVVEHGRTLRQEHRHVHHVRVKDLKQCEMLCEMASIRCQTVAFGTQRHDCFLSSVSVDAHSDLESLTHSPLLTPHFHATERAIPRKMENLVSSSTIPAENFEVAVVCLPGGMNVTFRVTGVQRYSGVVYAAERFSSCRTVIEDSQTFSLFLPRPSLNNSCNVLDHNGSLTSVIVLSNDLVLPLDITTKDDLFYEVRCDNDPHELSKTHYGLVIGGPDPKSVRSSTGKGQASKVLLKILKDDKPVENVLLGEKLKAIVESNVEASKLRVVDCSASRIGGPKNSVKLISEGCSLMPQVIGNIRENQNRLEVTLSAFRIDGSEQIDIACNVMVCKERCPKQQPCSRKRRQIVETAADLAIQEDSELQTVDRRLRVFVEREPPQAEDGIRNSYCFSAWTYFSTLGLLFVSLGSLSMFVCIGVRKRRWNNSHCDYDVGVVQIGTSTDGGFPIPVPTTIPRVSC
ncbi:hypothetical protein QR680_000364 [Steinernema hermaphroditum]|uniref:ZP domain-containing protein n=1 Tax=Steinernema hermaphroditum TaxID=289476 RepID=A0AA39GWC1_9BILA|nr:hypothetical protein QR680_000364 [Steinernema hermaphroditum]